MQYTIRGIPKELDKALRDRARDQGKSLNETAVAVLSEALNTNPTTKRRDLSDLVGSLTAADALAVEKSVAVMDKADVRSQKRASK